MGQIGGLGRLVVWIHGIKGTHRATNHQCTIPVTARNLFMALRRPSFRKVTPAQDIEKNPGVKFFRPKKRDDGGWSSVNGRPHFLGWHGGIGGWPPLDLHEK